MEHDKKAKKRKHEYEEDEEDEVYYIFIHCNDKNIFRVGASAVYLLVDLFS